MWSVIAGPGGTNLFHLHHLIDLCRTILTILLAFHLQNHTLFPIELQALRLSGTGNDSVFMGVVHKPEIKDTSAVKIWMTATGIVLCADELFTDAFGMEPATLVGQSFSSLGTDQSINQSKRKTSNANGQTNLGHKHKAPDHNHEATQPMVDLPHTS